MQPARTIFRKWAPILVAALVISGFALFASVPSATFFLQHLVSDQSLYFVMAKNIAQHGTARASLAENLPPFTYAFGVSYLYAWVFKTFSSFEQQIRGIHKDTCIQMCQTGQTLLWNAEAVT